MAMGESMGDEMDPTLSAAVQWGNWILAYYLFPLLGNIVKICFSLNKYKYPSILEQGRMREDTMCVPHCLKIWPSWMMEQPPIQGSQL